MQTEAERTLTADPVHESDLSSHGPSADFIYAISEFLNTDPKDLLVELGYYAQQQDDASGKAA